MAVAVDATSSGTVNNSNSLTIAHTCAGTNRVLVVAVQHRSTVLRLVSGITYAGVAMTQIGTAVISTDPYMKSELWALVAPALGTNNIVITLGNFANVVAGGVSFTGAEQALPTNFVSDAGNHGLDSEVTLNLASAVGNFCVDSYCRVTTAAASATGGQTERYNLATSHTGQNFRAGMSTEAGAASVNMSWTALDYLCYCALEIEAAAGNTEVTGALSTITFSSPAGSAGSAVQITGALSTIAFTTPSGSVSVPAPVIPGQKIEHLGLTNIEILVMDFSYVKKGLIPPTHLQSVTWKLNAPGTASFQMSSRDAAALLMLEGQREVRIAFKNYLRTDTGGPEMWQGTVGPSSAGPGEISFECDSLEHWLWQRAVDAATLTYEAVEQFAIGWDLVDKAQSAPFSTLGFTSSYTPSGVTQYLEAARDEHPYFGDLLDELVSLENGFDWEIYVDQTGLRRWTPYYPRRGTHQDKILFIYSDEVTKNILNYSKATSVEGMATRVINTGGTVEGEKLEAVYEDATASSTYRTRLKVISSGSSLDPVYLLSKAEAAVAVRKSPLVEISLKVRNRFQKKDGTWDYLLGKIHVGDWCKIRIDDGATQVGVAEFRIYSITWNKDETLDIEFMKAEGI